eukprot:1972428-Pyramimonas_sp.AAC.1
MSLHVAGYFILRCEDSILGLQPCCMRFLDFKRGGKGDHHGQNIRYLELAPLAAASGQQLSNLPRLLSW